MIQTLADVHEQFASFFTDKALQPWAWYLSKRLAEGHICVEVYDGGIESSGHPYDFSPDPLVLNRCTEYVSTDPAVIRPFILVEGKLYLHRYFNYESQLINKINLLLQQDPDEFTERLNLLQNHLPRLKDIMVYHSDVDMLPEEERPDWQFAASVLAFLYPFSIITGGPGTGKTTTVAKILALLYETNPSINVAMAAPTAKAADRMLESLNSTTLPLQPAILQWFKSLESKTIHRLLGARPDSIYFLHHSNNPLPFDVVIIDEASMIDMPQFSKLVQAVKPGTRLILLGDRNQLASVEAGSILGDLCNCVKSINAMPVPVIDLVNSYITNEAQKIPAGKYANKENSLLSGHIYSLQRNFRYAESPGIGRLSRAIIRQDIGSMTKIIDEHPDPETFVDTAYEHDRFKRFVTGYREFIETKDIAAALEKINNLRVLVAVKDGEQGLYAVNKRIEVILKKEGLIFPDIEFYENRPLLVTRNNYDQQIYNGNIGIVRTVNGRCSVWFPDPKSPEGVRALNPAQIGAAETVFAMTIHKSQGSEYSKVLVLLPDLTQHTLLTRELLYTAVTRAKKEVLIQGRKNTILQTIQSSVKRSSGIATRLK